MPFILSMPLVLNSQIQRFLRKPAIYFMLDMQSISRGFSMGSHLAVFLVLLFLLYKSILEKTHDTGTNMAYFVVVAFLENNLNVCSQIYKIFVISVILKIFIQTYLTNNTRNLLKYFPCHLSEKNVTQNVILKHFK